MLKASSAIVAAMFFFSPIAQADRSYATFVQLRVPEVLAVPTTHECSLVVNTTIYDFNFPKMSDASLNNAGIISEILEAKTSGTFDENEHTLALIVPGDGNEVSFNCKTQPPLQYRSTVLRIVFAFDTWFIREDTVVQNK